MFPVLLASCLALLLAGPGQAAPAAPPPPADAAAPPQGRAEWLWEPDPYYSSLALELPLTTTPVPDGGRLGEREVYTRLFRDSLRPRLLMLEASVYPLPAAGAWFKKHEPVRYDDFEVGALSGNRLNVLDGLTAGFQEPWALSAFVGSSLLFSGAGAAHGSRNRGYMGYLLSFGQKHIHDNVLIDDRWWEAEWKLKGEREREDEKLSWSFRLGLKSHGHPDIADAVYLGLRRSNLNYGALWLSLLNNSDLELLTELDRHSGRLLRQEAIVGRKLPLRRYRFAVALDVGVIYEDRAKYTGALTAPDADTLTFVVRPHLRF